jgi:phenylacetate-CoA ligase
MRPGENGIVLVTNKRTHLRTTVPVVSMKAAMFRRLVIGRRAEEDAAAVQVLRTEPVPILYGKPTYLLELLELDRALGGMGRIRPMVILVAGENLFEDDRARLEEWFGCVAYNSYASTEGGLLASECTHRTGLHVASRFVEMEVLTETGEVRREGTGELVLTNKLNWAMPFVRYRTGDWGTLRLLRCACGYEGPTLVELPGREARCFDTAHASRVDTHTLDRLFFELRVRAFQLIQRSPTRYLVRWAPGEEGVSPEKLQNFAAELRRHLGEVDLEFESAPRLVERGGKNRRYSIDPSKPIIENFP